MGQPAALAFKAKTMINFFRRIRKKLAGDSKPLKYMTYALGEIVLVVIGILIALQINNWNEKRRNDIMFQESIVFTDKSTSYVNIADYVDIHMSEKSNEQTTKETLKWVHIAISNAKRNFVGTYHKIKAKYLQLYLNEFVYKLNRRYFGERIFDRLVIASITAGGH